MSVVIDKTGPGFISAPTIERIYADGAIAVYHIDLVAKPDTQINISFGPRTDDEDDE
jgi:hypothetical protein